MRQIEQSAQIKFDYLEHPYHPGDVGRFIIRDARHKQTSASGRTNDEEQSVLLAGGISVLLLLVLLWPYVVDTITAPRRDEQRKRMLGAKFQSIRLQVDKVTLVPRTRWIGFVYVRPKDHTLTLSQNSAFELSDNRHWTHRYTVARIDTDGMILNFRDAGRSFFPQRSLKLAWK